MDKRDKYYRCFDTQLKDYLMSKGYEYEVIALDPKSRDKFWLFIRNNEVNGLILDWKHK